LIFVPQGRREASPKGRCTLVVYRSAYTLVHNIICYQGERILI